MQKISVVLQGSGTMMTIPIITNFMLHELEPLFPRYTNCTDFIEDDYFDQTNSITENTQHQTKIILFKIPEDSCIYVDLERNLPTIENTNISPSINFIEHKVLFGTKGMRVNN